MINFKTVLFVSLFTAAASAADVTAVAVPAAPAASAINSVTFTEGVQVWGKTDADTITELDSTLKGKLYDMLGWHVTVPVYSQNQTGYGAIDLGVDHQLVTNANIFGADTNLSVGGGAWLPTGSAGFGTPNVNPHVGVGYDMTWGSVSYTQTMDWRFVGKEAYTPVFGNAVDYLVNADSFVAYKWNTLAVGADLNQWYTSGSNVAFLGPKAVWNVSNSVSANAGVGFPVWQDAPQYEKNSCVVGLGVSIGF